MVVLLLIAALYVGMAVLRVLGVDGNRYTAAALALTPYGVLVGVVLGTISLLLRQWWVGGIVLAVTVVLAALVVPRTIRSAPAAGSRRLRLLSANLYLGLGDVKTVVALVREHDVDLLNLVELTPAAVEELDRAGLFDLLPYRVLHPAWRGAGSAVVSRHPLTERSLTGPSRLAQPSARVDIGDSAIEIVAVHPIPPTESAADWKRDMAALPAPDTEVPRILAGDFNATLDHDTFRRLLRAGYVDAAERRGAGLRATWPRRAFPPPVTLDHVVVDPRLGITAFRTFAVPGSDHKAVFAELALPQRETSTEPTT